MKLLRNFFVVLAFSLPLSAFAAVYQLHPGQDVIGRIQTITVNHGESFTSVARRYDLSIHELLEANPNTDPRRLRVGQKLVIPTQFVLPHYRNGIVINMPELRLYYFVPGGREVITYPVAMGRDMWRTPTTSTYVVRKEKYPTWHVPKSILKAAAENGKILPKKVPPGPANPLGERAIYLGKSGYLIHGNNQPSSIGKFVSSGCIRLSNQDVEELYELVPPKTRVRLIHHPIKVGWKNNMLYLESHIPVELDEAPTTLNYLSLDRAVKQATKQRPAIVNWELAREIQRLQWGVPQIIGQGVRGGLTQHKTLNELLNEAKS